MVEKIAVIGAGFTGLTAALELQQKGRTVSIFEKESAVGGLAGGFKTDGWNFPLEFHYHHFFASDNEAVNLMKKINVEYETLSPVTSIFKNKKIHRFDTPVSLLKFPGLSLLEKFRTGFVLLFLKLLPFNPLISPNTLFESQTAFSFCQKWLGKRSFEVLFKPLFTGKFGALSDKISAIWFWARIYKRTQKLIYPTGGFQTFAEALAQKIKEKGGEFFLSSRVESVVKKEGQWEITVGDQKLIFGKILITVPLSLISQLSPDLPSPKISHLDCLTLILETKRPILQKTYWLNINEEKFPFLSVVEHTNLVNKKNYGGNHVCYVGNYLPATHKYFNFQKEELIKIFIPYLKQINPSFFEKDIINSYLFHGINAQPVVTVGYKKLLPPIDLSQVDKKLTGLYVANMDMVYPWDRGVNYAIELGNKAASVIARSE